MSETWDKYTHEFDGELIFNLEGGSWKKEDSWQIGCCHDYDGVGVHVAITKNITDENELKAVHALRDWLNHHFPEKASPNDQ